MKVDVQVESPLRALYQAGHNDTLIISFAGAGRTDFEKPVNEFYKIATQQGQNHVLFLIDDSRSWLNGPGVAAGVVSSVNQVRDVCGARRVVALGNSMGGTMALHIAMLTDIDVVIALTPQYSVDPEIVPQEVRWKKFRSQIAEYKFRVVERFPGQKTQVTILHGDTDDELMHALKFPKAHAATSDVLHYILPGYGHDLAQKLHQTGELEQIILHSIERRRRRARQMIKRVGGIKRDRYAELISRSNNDTRDD